MSLPVSTIINGQIRILLRDIDVGGVQWKDSELLSWLDEACGEVARIRPESSSVTETVTNTQGCKQTIPAGGTMILEVICNGEDGSAIRPVERQILDGEDRNWRNNTSRPEVQRYVVSLTDPKTYYFYPNAPLNSRATIVYATKPETVNDMSDIFPLPEIYVSPVINWVVFRAYSKLTESANAKQIASDHLQLFNSQMGISDRSFEGRNAKVRHPEQA